MAFTDKTISCVQCGSSFVFTAGEQEFYSEKGYTNEPKRCKPCREDAKRSKGGSSGMSGGMGGSGSATYSSGPGNGGSTGSRSARQMWDIVCDNCQQPSQVPFQPTPGRKILCRNCFQSSRA
jgi:CxxC-x17-CxxC domain-containing protein